MSRQRISIAASALVDHVLKGGWVGASAPTYIKACRRLRGSEWVAVYRLAGRRYQYLWEDARRNFQRDADHWAYIDNNF